ncbi:MAG: hypothetical protein WBF53_00700 [Litorimonas sp.]
MAEIEDFQEDGNTMQRTTATGPGDARYSLDDFPLTTAPKGPVVATFIQGVWGKSQNLFSCFRTEDGTRFRIATFSRSDYAPYKAGPSLRYARPGDRYRLHVGRSGNDLPTLLTAELLDG